ncbi:MAG: Ig-like domain-containing protein, partial [Bacteroidales bacterium]|nr:Ig-like domain-containing protein [Bacteroidales bacterium]
SVTATSSNTSVATVTTSRSGNVTTITITAKTNGSATITVKANGNTSLSKTYALTVTKNSTVTWTSSDTSIATVSNGIVTAKNDGSASIAVKSVNDISKSIEIEVEDLDLRVWISLDEITNYYDGGKYSKSKFSSGEATIYE